VHPAGVSFTPSTALANVATQGYSSDFYSTSNTTMYQVSAASTVAGTNPTFTAKNRVYVGEATAGASAIASVVSYAFRGSYYNRISGIQAVSTRSLYSTNIGTERIKVTANIINKTADNGYLPGARVPYQIAWNNGTYTTTGMYPFQQLDRNTIGIIGNVNTAMLSTPASTPNNLTPATLTSWDTEIIIERLV
jgi:hypothetical protein